MSIPKNKTISFFIYLILSGIVLCTLFSVMAYAESCAPLEIATMRNSGLSEDVINQMCTRGISGAEVESSEVETFKNLANSGNAHASFQLGQMYEQGAGVHQDDVQAYAWYSKAYSISGNTEYRNARDTLEKKMSAQDVSQAQRLAESRDSFPITPSVPVPESPKPICREKEVEQWVKVTKKEDLRWGKRPCVRK